MKKQTMNNNFFLRQTHFLGVSVPDDITRTLEECRRYMNRVFGCKSGHKTPIHITLVPPFCLPESYTTDDLIIAIQNEVLPAAAKLCFNAHIDNFDAFGDRTIFAKVLQDEKWTVLRDKVFTAIANAVQGCIKKDHRPFRPHLTVANRDIPAGASVQALQTMNELHLVKDFPVDNITVFESRFGKWEAVWTQELK